MKKSIWISLAAFAIFVAGALAAIAIYKQLLKTS